MNRPFDPDGPILEWRRYRCYPGSRSAALALFADRLVSEQRRVGCAIHGVFICVDDADSFLWFRGFSDSQTRQAALSAFYGGAVWTTSAAEVLSIIQDYSNVRLLQGSSEETDHFRTALDELCVGDLCVVGLHDAPSTALSLHAYSETEEPSGYVCFSSELSPVSNTRQDRLEKTLL